MDPYIPKVGDKIFASQLSTGEKVLCIVEQIRTEPQNKGTDIEHFYVCRPLARIKHGDNHAINISSVLPSGLIWLTEGEMHPCP